MKNYYIYAKCPSKLLINDLNCSESWLIRNSKGLYFELNQFYQLSGEGGHFLEINMKISEFFSS
jgi:hypothetical protein